MQSLKTLTVAAVLAIAAPFAVTAHAQTMKDHATMGGMNAPGMKTDDTTAARMTDGEVRKIDKENQKITLKHGDIMSLDMPGMTMVFRVKAPSMLDKLQVGSKVRFAAEKAGGVIVVTAIESVK